MNDNIDNINSDYTAISSGQKQNPDEKKHNGPFAYLFDILFTGTAGWKRLRRSRLTPEQTAANCFYPILAIAAVCKFADWFYLPDFSLSDTLVNAASIFASFFFSFFSVIVLCKLFLPVEAKSKTENQYFKLLVQYSLSSLALFWIPSEVFPVVEPIAVFLPIWTVFIITKGVRFLRLPEKHRNRCMVTIIVTIVLMPYIFMWLFDKIF